MGSRIVRVSAPSIAAGFLVVVGVVLLSQSGGHDIAEAAISATIAINGLAGVTLRSSVGRRQPET